MNEIFLTKDVLTEPQRKKLLEDLKPFLKDFPGVPGRQSNQDLHSCSQFNSIFEKVNSFKFKNSLRETLCFLDAEVVINNLL